MNKYLSAIIPRNGPYHTHMIYNHYQKLIFQNRLNLLSRTEPGPSGVRALSPLLICLTGQSSPAWESYKLPLSLGNTVEDVST